MKKIIGLVLVFVLVFTVAADALAGSRPKITKQPESATVKKGGKVSFSIKTTGTVDTVTWYFVDPETGNSYTGKKIAGAVKGVKVDGPTNSKKITLKNVPETMHGWKVYAHVNGNGYTLNSDEVLLLIAGMETDSEAPADTTPEASPSDIEQTTPDANPADENPPADTTDAQTPQADETAETVQKSGPFTVSATSKVLRMLDASGNIIDSEPTDKLQFESIGYVLVTTEDPIVSWTLNGIRVEPEHTVKEFRITNITSDLLIDVKTRRPTSADVVVDETRMCKVVCKGCTFSYSRGKLKSVSEGEVPAGAPINVFADSSDLAKGGYSINGGEPENAGKAGFQFIVNEDVEIVCQ